MSCNHREKEGGEIKREREREKERERERERESERERERKKGGVERKHRAM